MLILIIRNLLRRPLRTALTLAGIAAAMAVLVCTSGLGNAYRRNLQGELERTGVHAMLVPLGCPYDAAARVLKNHSLEASMPADALASARRDPAVAVAAPLLMAALPRANQRRVDLWVGIDESVLPLKPWWRCRAGRAWFAGSNDIIVGAEAAALEMRRVGDKLYSPEAGREFHVAGILERSGTSDDSAFFVPLATAQSIFHQQGRLTAVALRFRDPTLVREATPRLDKTPGAQVVTLSEMMGTFLNLLGVARTLVRAVAGIALTVSALSVFNTLLAAVLERANELAVMRALGASRLQVALLLAGESVVLTLCGAAAGAAAALLCAGSIDSVVKNFFPLAPQQGLVSISAGVVISSAAASCAVGLIAAAYPAWRASRLAPALAVKSD